MRSRRVRYADSFGEALRACTLEIQRRTIAAVQQFINRSAEHSLRPERKAGLHGIWAFRVTSGVRVFYTQQRDEAGSYSLLFHVGPHDDYRTVERRRPRHIR
jgi:hypothetical protein